MSSQITYLGCNAGDSKSPQYQKANNWVMNTAACAAGMICTAGNSNQAHLVICYCMEYLILNYNLYRQRNLNNILVRTEVYYNIIFKFFEAIS